MKFPAETVNLGVYEKVEKVKKNKCRKKRRSVKHALLSTAATTVVKRGGAEGGTVR